MRVKKEKKHSLLSNQLLLTLSGCNDCGLKKQWPYLAHPQIPVIPPKLQGIERILGIGEGPGAEEDFQNNVFVGTTGQFLRRTIPNDWRERLYWSNTVRCFISPKTSILTLEGYKQLRKVKPGELVLTHKGRWRPVEQVLYLPGETSYVRITFNTGDTQGVTLDHRYLLPTGEWVLARNLKPNDEIMFLAETCVVCGTAFYKDFTKYKKVAPLCSEKCVKIFAIKTGTEAAQSEEVKVKLRSSLLEQYASGKRDRFETTKEANRIVREKIKDGSWFELMRELGKKGQPNLAKLRETGWHPTITEEAKIKRRINFALARQAFAETALELRKDKNYRGHIGYGEVELATLLKTAGIEYTAQFAIEGRNYDFKIKNLIFEIIGPNSLQSKFSTVVSWYKEKEELANKFGLKVHYIPYNQIETVLDIIENDEHLFNFIPVKVGAIEIKLWKFGVYSLTVEEDESFVAQGAVHHNCRPPENRTPKLDEVTCCSVYLEEDLSKIKPHALLAIGAVALDYFWAGTKVSDGRGLSFPVQLEDKSWVWCYSIFHPSFVLRGQRKDGTNTIYPVWKSDIERFFNNFPEFLTPPKPRRIPTKTEVLYPKSLEEVKTLFNRLVDPGFDIETFQLKPYLRDAKILTAAFGDGNTIFAFPVNWPGLFGTGYTWGMKALDWCLSQNRKWIGHNSGFELTWAWYNFPDCSFLTPYEDSMARARVKYGRKSMLSLNAQTKLTLGVEIKSITGVDSAHLDRYTLEEVLYYNALDAWASWVIHNDVEIDDTGQSVYNRLLDATRSTVTMELLGLNIDLSTSLELKKDLIAKKEHINEEARQLPEVKIFEQVSQQKFSISSPMDVGDCLVKFCGLDLPRTPGGKQYSTDEEDLQELLGKHLLVDLTIDFREVNKQITTYVEPILQGKQLGVDGLIHPSYTTTLTATGRLSCQNPNIQNWPVRKHREVRKQVTVPEGFVLAAFDFGQIEARMLGMVTRDTKLLQSFYNHEDIHAKWLNRIIQLHPGYLDRLSRISGQTEEKAVWKAGRTAIKTDFVFASFYGSQASSVANRTQIPHKICEELLYEFWREYPRVKDWLQETKDFYQKNGYIQTITGLIRNELMDGNEPINTPIQGASAHLMLEAQIALWKYAIETNDFNFLPRISVHDDITYVLKEDSDLEKRLEIIGKKMVEPRFTFSICPLIVEAKIGYNWFEMDEIGKWEGEYLPI